MSRTAGCSSSSPSVSSSRTPKDSNLRGRGPRCFQKRTPADDRHPAGFYDFDGCKAFF